MQLGLQKDLILVRHTGGLTSVRIFYPQTPLLKDPQVINQTIQELQPKLFDLLYPGPIFS